ncbi:hypothetical protein BaRGS_00027168, partial [Batillaria attramentaria]
MLGQVPRHLTPDSVRLHPDTSRGEDPNSLIDGARWLYHCVVAHGTPLVHGAWYSSTRNVETIHLIRAWLCLLIDYGTWQTDQFSCHLYCVKRTRPRVLEKRGTGKPESVLRAASLQPRGIITALQGDNQPLDRVQVQKTNAEAASQKLSAQPATVYPTSVVTLPVADPLLSFDPFLTCTMHSLRLAESVLPKVLEKDQLTQSRAVSGNEELGGTAEAIFDHRQLNHPEGTTFETVFLSSCCDVWARKGNGTGWFVPFCH